MGEEGGIEKSAKAQFAARVTKREEDAKRGKDRWFKCADHGVVSNGGGGSGREACFPRAQKKTKRKRAEKNEERAETRKKLGVKKEVGGQPADNFLHRESGRRRGGRGGEKR